MTIQHADQLQEREYGAFLSYCGIWAEFLHDHHDTEELISFPFFEKYGQKFEDVIKELNGEHRNLIPSIEGVIALAALPPTAVSKIFFVFS